ncbi:MAG: T9SS type A sorting domain-containing protein [Ignavibacteriaceae bacterium]
MKKYILVVFLLIFSTYFYAQNFWVQTTITISTVTSMTIDLENNIYFTQPLYGIYKSTDDGEHYFQLSTPSARYPKCIKYLNNYLYASSEYGAFRSEDGGANWTVINDGLNNSRPLCYCINNEDKLFAGAIGGKIFYSTNRGDNWIDLSFNFPNYDINCIAVNSSNDVYVGTSDGGIYLLQNNENSWVPMNNGLTSLSINVLLINSNGRIFAGTEGSGVYVSTNNGDNWNELNTGLISAFVRDLTIDEREIILVATEKGVFKLENGVTFWDDINSGIDTNWISIYSLAINSEGYLFAGSARPFYKSTSPFTSIGYEFVLLRGGYFLSENYPNPFNPSTKINFQLPNAGNVTLKVFDVLGREVATLIDEYKNADSYEVEFNASNMPSGVYFYQLKAGEYIETKKMILIK